MKIIKKLPSINGRLRDAGSCDIIVREKKKFESNSIRIDELMQELKRLEEENEKSQEIIDSLLKDGFCSMDELMQRRDPMTGRVIKEWLGHRYWCKNRKNNNKEGRNGLAK